MPPKSASDVAFFASPIAAGAAELEASEVGAAELAASELEDAGAAAEVLLLAAGAAADVLLLIAPLSELPQADAARARTASEAMMPTRFCAMRTYYLLRWELSMIVQGQL
ncbi:hypothetical protein [Nakamurella antarctica]|uniref:hypothetical protein n=1 Tax=Nakamurella antarctica TaxID=1902245 RepID=UPI0019D301C6|nr:hypothetical protein [Nakamurella antarctica]